MPSWDFYEECDYACPECGCEIVPHQVDDPDDYDDYAYCDECGWMGDYAEAEDWD